MKKILISVLVAGLLVSNISPNLSTSAYINYMNVAATTAETVADSEYESYLKYKTILKKEVSKSFNGTNTSIDLSNEVNSIKDISSGTVAMQFKTGAVTGSKTIFSISDSNDISSYFEVKIKDGYVRLEIFENGVNTIQYQLQAKRVDDNELHTVVISSGEAGSFAYLDGVKLADFTTHPNKFISSVKTPNTINIGRMVNKNGATTYFQGEIKYVEVYNTQFSDEYALKYSLNDYRSILNIVHSKEKSTIVFSGDSITHGVRHTNGYRSYSEHVRDRILGETIDGKMKDPGSFVINTGVSNGDTDKALSGYTNWIGTYNADIVFVTLGMNDCVVMTLDKYKENIRTLVSKIRAQGSIPVLQTINTIKSSDTRRKDVYPQLVEAQRELAKELEVFLIDHYEYWEKKGSTVTYGWLNDEIHPNAIGHLEITKLILRELQLDNPESDTQNLAYPLEGDGTAKPVVDVSTITYPEYLSVENKIPVASYKVNREFYGSEYIDRTDDMNKIKSLATGSVVARFNVTSPDTAQTLLSLSDNKDASKEVAIAINSNGVVTYHARTDKGNLVFTTAKGGYNDGKWHTLVVNSDNKGVKIYVDGAMIHESTSKIFFSSLSSPTHLSIGRNVHDQGGEWFYKGSISYIDVYDKALTVDEINSISPAVESTSDFSAIKAKALQTGVANTWALIGDNSTSGNSATYGYKNYGQYLEERVRMELNVPSMIERERYVINSGVDGADSKDFKDNFDAWVAEFDPEIVSIMLGGSEKGSEAEFEANLKDIIAKAKALNAEVLLQTPVLQNNDISSYVDVVVKVGKELNIPVIDHYNTWKKLEVANTHIKDTFLNDDYTLNHRGHLRVANDMMKALGMFDANSISAGSKVDMKYTEAETPTNLKNSLTELINKSKKSIEDNKDKPYSEELKAALVADIAAAEREVEKTNSTVSTVSNAVSFLNSSLSLFEASVKEVNPYDVNKDGLVNIKDLALVSKHYNKNSSDSAWNTIKVYDVNKDNAINDLDVNELMDEIILE